MKIKKGDKVKVLAGREKGKTGIVEKAIPTEDRVIIEGLNTRKIYKKSQGTKEAIDVAMPMHVSNVARVTEEKKKTKTATKSTEKKTTKQSK